MYHREIYLSRLVLLSSGEVSGYNVSMHSTDREKFGNGIEREVLGDDQAIFNRFSIAFVFFLFGSYLLAVFGIFTKSVIIVLSVANGIGLIIFLWKLRPSKEFFQVGIALFAFMALLLFPLSPSVFSGRDQGSYAGAAIRLAADHSLLSNTPSVAKDFFHIYGEGKALNVPGFFYTKDGALTTQFPLGYIVWLGAFVSLFGLAGFSLANACTFFLSLSATFLFLRRFLPFPFAVGGIFVAALSFPFLWILDNTLSENLATFLFLFISFHLVSFVRNPTLFSWWLAVSGSIFFFLTRIEGFFVLIAFFLIVLFQRESRIFLKTRVLSATLPSLALSGAFFATSLSVSLPFYRTVGKALLDSSPLSQTASSGIPVFSALFRNTEIFWTYGMISVFALALLGGVFLFMKKKFFALIPFFLALPTFLYMISPHISGDHPWMLRRFAFSLWPVAIILAVFGMSHFQKKFSEKYPGKLLFRPLWFSVFFSSLLILPAFPSIISNFFSSENVDLLEDAKKLSEKFSDRDLVLVDQMASGDRYSMIADPMSTLFDRNAIYFFNPGDLERVNLFRFENVYLVVRNGDETRYRESFENRFTLESAFPYSLRTSVLSRETDPSRLPVRKNETVNGMVFRILPRN